MTRVADDLTKFQWSPQPQAAALVQELLDDFLRRCPDAAKFADRLHRETGTRLIDWVASIGVPDDRSVARRLGESGFVVGDANSNEALSAWKHPDGLFPSVMAVRDVQACASGACPAGSSQMILWVKVDSVADFAFRNGITEGSPIWLSPPLSRCRMAPFAPGREAAIFVVELHGTTVLGATMLETLSDDEEITAALWVGERFRLRKRRFASSAEGFLETSLLVDELLEDMDKDRAADLFFAAEREYWMSRNRAAQIQYARQQKLGLGWANHDHHTYRSSREHFKDMIAIFEKLGLVCRERFYAGREAGWGAQVMEQPNAGIVVFADVDLSPDEVTADFAHEPLPPRKELGTVGLWCALHGESFLEAGMHHLECQFDFDAAREQLKALGINSMKPFTDFPWLKQCFTEGEMWPVDSRRIDALLAAGRITAEQAEKFRREGAIGSHLEILERNDGYKGFNQTGISEIIRDTDPRRVEHRGAEHR